VDDIRGEPGVDDNAVLGAGSLDRPSVATATEVNKRHLLAGVL